MTAIEPGSSKELELYRLAADTFGSEEIAAAKDVFDSGQFTMGPRVRAFEREFADWIGARHAVMVNSGSSANLLIADSLVRSTDALIQPGDEVIVPGLAWPTTVWPLAQLGLVPAFADVEHATMAIDLESAATLIGPRSRAMFLIHPLGRALDLEKYKGFCDAHGLLLIEDCCESLGAYWNGKHVGTEGRAASFSFYFSHHISTIEGGMITTDDDALADDYRSLRAHGWIRDRTDRAHWVEEFPEFDPRFLFARLGYNVRPTEIQGALGSVQLRRLEDMLRAREIVARTFSQAILDHAPWLELIGSDAIGSAVPLRRQDRGHSWMTLPVRVLPTSPLSRNQVMSRLEELGIETRPIIAGNLARHPATQGIRHRVAADMTESDALLERSFMIGCHPTTSDAVLATLERAVAAIS